MKSHQHNLIGKHVRVTDAKNKTLVGKEGVVQDETKNTITVNDQKIIKDYITIDGGKKLISKTPTERIKVHQ
ncbi:ribonuclease P protein subunit [Candidatus Woesearchaeota archaeon]|nr:ribonuclease P protein subunit [Candidatus Woesearchaeota archaeon]